MMHSSYVNKMSTSKAARPFVHSVQVTFVCNNDTYMNYTLLQIKSDHKFRSVKNLVRLWFLDMVTRITNIRY
jgi:hypothetical protein